MTDLLSALARSYQPPTNLSKSRERTYTEAAIHQNQRYPDQNERLRQLKSHVKKLQQELLEEGSSHRQSSGNARIDQNCPNDQ